MKALVTKVEPRQSYRGGWFFWYFFKRVGAATKNGEARSYRTCTGPEFANFQRWKVVRKGFILDNLELRSGRLIDADSQFTIVGMEQEREKNS